MEAIAGGGEGEKVTVTCKDGRTFVADRFVFTLEMMDLVLKTTVDNF